MYKHEESVERSQGGEVELLGRAQKALMVDVGVTPGKPFIASQSVDERRRSRGLKPLVDGGTPPDVTEWVVFRREGL